MKISHISIILNVESPGEKKSKDTKTKEDKAVELK